MLNTQQLTTELSSLASNILFQQHRQRLTGLNYCTWEGAGKLIDFMARERWYFTSGFTPALMSWEVEAARAFPQLPEYYRGATVEAFANSKLVDNVPALIALAFICTHKTIAPTGFAERYDGFRVTTDADDRQVFITIE